MHIKDLQPASFRNASFLAPDTNTQEGRNSVPHNYPDQLMRYVEDNGHIPPCFDVKAVLHGPNLVSDLARLRSALKRPGPGVLKHPVFGSQFVMVDQTYSIHQTERDSGVIELDIKFITTGAPVFPGLLTGVAAVVSQIATSAIQSAFEEFIERFESPKAPRSIVAVADSIKLIADSFIGRFNRASGDARQLVSKAGIIAQNMQLSNDIWFKTFRRPIDDEAINNEDLITGYNAIRKSARKVVQDAAKIEPTTRDLSIRKNALTQLGEFNEYAAFLLIAEAMASRIYVTGDQVDYDEDLLAEAYHDLQEGGLPAEQHADMYDVYIATSDILSKAAVRLPRLTEIDAKERPASVLAYQLYEQDGMNRHEISSQEISIIGLNARQNPSYLGKETTVLTRV